MVNTSRSLVNRSKQSCAYGIKPRDNSNKTAAVSIIRFYLVSALLPDLTSSEIHSLLLPRTGPALVVVFPYFFDFGSKFCVTNLQYCNFFFTYLIKLDLPHSLITKSGKVITKNMHKTLCVAQNIGSLIRGRQYLKWFRDS